METLTTHRFPVEQAAGAYAPIAGKAQDPTRPIGLLLQYLEGQADVGRSLVEVKPRPRTPAERVSVGMVDAGNFATRVLLPALMATEKVQPVGIATSSGATARRVAETYGFAHATSDSDALIKDPADDAVVVATRHDSHAPLAARALRDGKATFCEKPLATTWEGLEDVASAWTESGAPLLVGFNPAVLTPHRHAAGGVAARCAGGRYRPLQRRPDPHDHWMRDPISRERRPEKDHREAMRLYVDLASGVRESRAVAEAGMASAEARSK